MLATTAQISRASNKLRNRIMALTVGLATFCHEWQSCHLPAHSCHPPGGPMLKKIVCVAIPGMAPFEFGVICEVFGIDRSAHNGPVFDFEVVTAVPGALRTKLGFDIVVHQGLDAAADADLIAIPAYEAGTEIHPDVLRVV